MDNSPIEKIVDRLRTCGSVLFITGAGISADSGLPTYRGIGGLYNDQHTDDGIPIEEALSGRMMRTNPALCWKYLSQIELACRGARFNRGHEIIAEMEKRFERLWILTQNIDSFHHQAGSKNIIDIHGSSHKLICTQCSYSKTVADYSGLDMPPHCPACSAIVRPDVVLFGEMLATDKCDLLSQQLAQGFDIVFSIGTTSVFPYIAQPVIQAKHLGSATIEINPSHTEVSGIVDFKIPLGAADALEKIWSLYHKI